jgi:hypothetical protein
MFYALTGETLAIAQSSDDFSKVYEFFGGECMGQFGPSAAPSFTVKYCDCVASSIIRGLSPDDIHARAMGFRILADRDLVTVNEMVCDTKKELVCLPGAPKQFQDLCNTYNK